MTNKERIRALVGQVVNGLKLSPLTVLMVDKAVGTALNNLSEEQAGNALAQARAFLAEP